MQRPKHLVVLLALTTASLLILLAACGPKKEEPAPVAPPVPAPGPVSPSQEVGAGAEAAEATLAGHPGSTVAGKVSFTQEGELVRVVVEVSGVTGAGPRGLHVCEVPDCASADFSSAGDHFNPMAMPHGGPSSPQRHAGDLGNVEIGADGRGRLELVTDMLSVAPSLNGVIGRSVVLHEKADDLQSQPSGAAGGRLACGVILPRGGTMDDLLVETVEELLPGEEPEDRGENVH